MKKFEVCVRTYGQLEAVLQKAESVKRCYVSADLLLSSNTQNEARDILLKLTASGTEIFAAMPYMTREEAETPDITDLESVSSLVRAACLFQSHAGHQPDTGSDTALTNCDESVLTGVLVRNMEQLGYLAEQSLLGQGFAGKVVLDAQIYMWNSQAVNELKSDEALADKLCGYTLPLEESARQWKDTIRADRSGLEPIIMIYGRVPMMVSAGCVLKTTKNCSGHKGEFYAESAVMEDRTGRKLPVECCCRYCYNVIWNAYPLSLHKAYFTGMLPGDVSYRLDFTTETKKEVVQVISFFENGADASSPTDAIPPYAEYTTGRYQKGVD